MHDNTSWPARRSWHSQHKPGNADNSIFSMLYSLWEALAAACMQHQAQLWQIVMVSIFRHSHFTLVRSAPCCSLRSAFPPCMLQHLCCACALHSQVAAGKAAPSVAVSAHAEHLQYWCSSAAFWLPEAFLVPDGSAAAGCARGLQCKRIQERGGCSVQALSHELH